MKFFIMLWLCLPCPRYRYFSCQRMSRTSEFEDTLSSLISLISKMKTSRPNKRVISNWLTKPLHMKSKKADLTYCGDGLSYISHVFIVVSAKSMFLCLVSVSHLFLRGLLYLRSLAFKNLQSDSTLLWIHN